MTGSLSNLDELLDADAAVFYTVNGAHQNTAHCTMREAARLSAEPTERYSILSSLLALSRVYPRHGFRNRRSNFLVCTYCSLYCTFSHERAVKQ